MSIDTSKEATLGGGVVIPPGEHSIETANKLPASPAVSADRSQESLRKSLCVWEEHPLTKPNAPV